ncbi:MAG: thioredoxin family protein [Steroidobacteraceae bacterium]
MRLLRATLGVLLVVMAGCQRAESDKPTAPEQPVAAEASGIHWFEGDVDAAFVAAAAEKKPVFLYWGAEWCPPCHELKAHVFSRLDFQEKLKQFIPVYLDGDAPGAQLSGEQFRVSGYPTALVLAPDRTEIARIAGGQDLSSYAELLDLALDQVTPLSQVLATLRSSETAKLARSDCRRIAYNGWALDPQVEAGELIGDLTLAADRCPVEAVHERDRLLLAAADLAARAERKTVETGNPPSERLTKLLDGVDALLADDARALATSDALLSLGEDFFVLERLARPARITAFRARWFALMDRIEIDGRLSPSSQLLSAASRLQAAKSLESSGNIPDAVATRSRQTLDAFLARDYDADARSALVNSASWVLTLLGDDDRLRGLLENQIRTSGTPYYYLPDLADLEEKAGRKTEALALLERGYRESRGIATRFQWGGLYVNGLLRMSPRDEPRIRAALLDVIAELDGPNRIHARARSRLERLRPALATWADETKNRPTLAAVGERWEQICNGLPESDPIRAECSRLL